MIIKTMHAHPKGSYVINRGMSDEASYNLTPPNDETEDAVMIFNWIRENTVENWYTDEEKAIEKNKLSYQSSLKNEANSRSLRAAALDLLAQKAIAEDSALYESLVSSADIERIFLRWERVGHTQTAMSDILGLTGDIRAVLETVVGEKNRTIQDYIFYTMAEATNDLALLDNQ